MSASSSSLTPIVQLNTGASISRVGLGTWRAAPGECESIVYEAIKLGYRHIDCARLYGNEAEVGRGIQRAIKENLIKREDLFVTSKVWNNAHSAEHTRADLSATLKDLQLEYVDLYLIHWPVNFKYVEGNMFPRNEKGHIIHETDENVASVKICYQTLEAAVGEGKCKAIGVSNFNEQQIEDLMKYAKIKPAMNQIEAHPYWQQDELIAYCHSKSIQVSAYCPLGNLKAAGEENVTPLNDEKVLEIAKKLGKSPAQVILRWGIQHVGVVLPKSSNLGRLAENIALYDFSLSDEDMKVLKQVGEKKKRFINPAVNADGSKFFPQ